MTYSCEPRNVSKSARHLKLVNMYTYNNISLHKVYSICVMYSSAHVDRCNAFSFHFSNEPFFINLLI